MSQLRTVVRENGDIDINYSTPVKIDVSNYYKLYQTLEEAYSHTESEYRRVITKKSVYAGLMTIFELWKYGKSYSYASTTASLLDFRKRFLVCSPVYGQYDIIPTETEQSISAEMWAMSITGSPPHGTIIDLCSNNNEPMIFSDTKIHRFKYGSDQSRAIKDFVQLWIRDQHQTKPFQIDPQELFPDEWRDMEQMVKEQQSKRQEYYARQQARRQQTKTIKGTGEVAR